MLLPSQIGSALGDLRIIIMKALLVCNFKDETFKSQVFTNATSYRCWLTQILIYKCLCWKPKPAIDSDVVSAARRSSCKFYQNCCKVKTLWISMNSYDRDKQNRIACVPSIAWYLLQIKATAMRSSLNWHFIPDQFWKRQKENKAMLHANLEGFCIQICTGRPSRTTIPWNKPLCHLAVNSPLTTPKQQFCQPQRT